MTSYKSKTPQIGFVIFADVWQRAEDGAVGRRLRSHNHISAPLQPPQPCSPSGFPLRSLLSHKCTHTPMYSLRPTYISTIQGSRTAQGSHAFSPLDGWAAAVCAHGSLVCVGPNVWQVTGELGVSPLFRWERNMTIIRMRDGDLVIHNAIAVSEERMKEIESLGTPKVLIVPNAHHRRDAHVCVKVPVLKCEHVCVCCIYVHAYKCACVCQKYFFSFHIGGTFHQFFSSSSSRLAIPKSKSCALAKSRTKCKSA